MATEKQDILGNDGLYENISSALLFDETNKLHLPESRHFNARPEVTSQILNIFQ